MLFVNYCTSQTNFCSRFTSLGEAGLYSATDALSFMYNPSNLMNSDSLCFTSHYSPDIFEIPGLSKKAFAGNLNMRSLALGFGISGFGNKLYNEFTAIIGVACKFPHGISAGIAFSYLKQTITNYGSNNNYFLGLGLNYELLQGYCFSLSIQNIYINKSNKFENSYFPLINVGISAEVNRFLKLFLLINNENYRRAVTKFGAELVFFENITVSTGYIPYTNKSAFGVGLHFLSYRIQFALTHHKYLGFSKCIDFTWIYK